MTEGKPMGLSIVEVSRISGVSSRTLRHYDAIGLLTPAYVGGNGYRYYETEQLLRLQQILLLRELRLELSGIGEILDGNENIVAALRRHRRGLAVERDRLAHLERTVDDTIARLEGAHPVNAERLFDGFRADRQQKADTEKALVHRFGEQAREYIEQGKARKQNWSEKKTRRINEEGDAIFTRLAELYDDDASVDDERVLDAIDQHYRWIREGWDATAAAYIGLGKFYVEHDSIREVFEAHRPGLAEYLRDAITYYTRTRLM